MQVTKEDWQRVEDLRRRWTPPENGGSAGPENEGLVTTHQVRGTQHTDEGITYYPCGGGRRVIRKRLGGN